MPNVSHAINIKNKSACMRLSLGKRNMIGKQKKKKEYIRNTEKERSK